MFRNISAAARVVLSRNYHDAFVRVSHDRFIPFYAKNSARDVELLRSTSLCVYRKDFSRASWLATMIPEIIHCEKT